MSSKPLIRVYIGNSYSKVEGLTTALQLLLKKVLSYSVNTSAVYTGGFVRKKALLDRAGMYPTGLTRRVYAFLDKHGLKHEVIDVRVVPKPKKLFKANWSKLPPPYETQLDAVQCAFAKKRGILSMPTGTGKSRTMAMLIERFQVPTLVVVPTIELKTQLSETFRDIFGSLKHITVENIAASSLAETNDYGLLLLEEAHHGAARTYQQLNKNCWNTIFYRFFLTATPFRSNADEDLLLEGLTGKLIYRLSYADAVKKGQIVPVEAYTVKVPKQATDAVTYQEIYSELVVNNDMRNGLIADLATNLQEAQVSTLILVKEVKHGDNLVKLTGLPFVNGKDDDSRKYISDFNSGKIKVLIATEGLMGEGIDTKPCEYVLIAGAGKAKGAFMQKVGRGVRRYGDKKSAKIVLFRDTSHKYLLKHFRTQVKILKDEYNIVPLSLD